MSEEKSLTTQAPAEKAVEAFGGTGAAFDLAQRKAKALAESDFTPQAFRGKVANCLIAIDLASRSGTSPLTVMQNLNVIHGKPGWSAQYVIGALNVSPKFKGDLRFENQEEGTVSVGGKAVKNYTCRASATSAATGEVLTGPKVSVDLAVKEGWFQKTGSKWQTMPELMVQYRAATFFGRLYAPEVLLGMQTEQEARDVGPQSDSRDAAERRSQAIRERAEQDIETKARPVTE